MLGKYQTTELLPAWRYTKYTTTTTEGGGKETHLFVMATTKMIKQLLPDIAHAKEQQHQQQQVLEQDHIEAEVKPDRLSWPASRPRTPKDVVQARLKQDAGLPDNGLAIDDFDLIKTLGTGTCQSTLLDLCRTLLTCNRHLCSGMVCQVKGCQRTQQGHLCSEDTQESRR